MTGERVVNGEGVKAGRMSERASSERMEQPSGLHSAVYVRGALAPEVHEWPKPHWDTALLQR